MRYNNLFTDKFELKVVVGGLAAWRGSQGLAYLSTACYVTRLNFRVRDGTGCSLVLWPPKPLFNVSFVFTNECDGGWLICGCCVIGLVFLVLLVDFALECEAVFVFLAGWAVSGCGLSVSLPWRVHSSSINTIFYGGPRKVSFQGVFRA